MKEIPLIFTGPMVRAILEGRKTQTRRLTGRLLQPGDRIWVREMWAENVPGCEFQGGYSYRADHHDPNGDGPANPMKWRYSMFMPKRASRITLEVTAPSRLEYLHDITEEDAKAEGLPWSDQFRMWEGRPGLNAYFGQARLAFKSWWIHLHGAKSWSANPLVYVHTFKRVTP